LEEVGRVSDTTDFPLMADEGPEDLPRTLRREREAREREKREREAKARSATLTHDFGASDRSYGAPPDAVQATPAVVTRFNVPFFRLMTFFIKAVFAAIPALILLGGLLWFAGAILKTYYPELVHTEIIIRVPR
jgi:hypothetical protein